MCGTYACQEKASTSSRAIRSSAPFWSKRHNSIFSATSLKSAKFVPAPSYVAPSGKARPGHTSICVAVSANGAFSFEDCRPQGRDRDASVARCDVPGAHGEPRSRGRHDRPVVVAEVHVHADARPRKGHAPRALVHHDVNALAGSSARRRQPPTKRDQVAVPGEHPGVEVFADLFPAQLRPLERREVLRIGDVFGTPAELFELVRAAVSHGPAQLRVLVRSEVEKGSACRPLLALEHNRGE